MATKKEERFSDQNSKIKISQKLDHQLRKFYLKNSLGLQSTEQSQLEVGMTPLEVERRMNLKETSAKCTI